MRSLLWLWLAIACNAEQTWDQLFTVDWNTCSRKNIDGRFDKVLKYAYPLMKSSVTGIAELQEGAITDDEEAMVFTDTSLMRRLRNAGLMWGIPYYPQCTPGGLNDEDEAKLAEVGKRVDWGQQLLQGKQTGPNDMQLKPDNILVACGDESYRKTTNAHDIDSDVPDGTSTQDSMDKPWVWHIPPAPNTRKPKQSRKYIFPEGREREDRLCQPDDTAIVFYQPPGGGDRAMIQMILCPPFWADDVRFDLDTGHQPRAVDYLGAYKFASAMFIHELYHTFGPMFSDKEYTVKGAGKKIFKPYGADRIAAIANYPKRFKAVKTGDAVSTLGLPDAFQFFAVASHWPGTDWRPFLPNMPVPRNSL